ncbi:MAG TPA: alpha/beta hydrolase [Anaerolineae bacterium]|nr:alpha/beta hydrolase [Anaerolineae bacterium]HMR66633.1 alpha/beta hydrolase [Anaerolineae bacterium]
MTTAIDKFIDVGLKLHLRDWPGEKTAFILLHGLASNCRTWDGVAHHLAAAGHRVVTVDQRGHGLSDKPEAGYDFATIAGDLQRLLLALSLEQPILVGQSWGGNVLLEFGRHYPQLARGLIFVDGGFLDLGRRPDGTWEQISEKLRPPNLTGTPRELIKQRLRTYHPDWTEEGLESTLANFKTLSDGTVRPWLTLERHMRILRAIWEQDVQAIFPRVTVPVLICAAGDSKNPDWTAVKCHQVDVAERLLPRVKVHWFLDTDHDIHVQKPQALAHLFLATLADGFWRD